MRQLPPKTLEEALDLYIRTKATDASIVSLVDPFEAAELARHYAVALLLVGDSLFTHNAALAEAQRQIDALAAVNDEMREFIHARMREEGGQQAEVLIGFADLIAAGEEFRAADEEATELKIQEIDRTLNAEPGPLPIPWEQGAPRSSPFSLDELPSELADQISVMWRGKSADYWSNMEAVNHDLAQEISGFFRRQFSTANGTVAPPDAIDTTATEMPDPACSGIIGACTCGQVH